MFVSEVSRNIGSNLNRDDSTFETDFLSKGINNLIISEQTLTERAINSVRVDAKEVKSKMRHN